MLNKKIPEWKNKGTEPSENLKENGFVGGYHPPANVFNWFWASVIEAITELQNNAEANVFGVPIINVTSTDGVTYTGTIQGLETLVIGKPIVIIPNTTSTTPSVKLNLNNLGEKYIRESLYGSQSSSTPDIASWIAKNVPLMIMYDGTSFRTIYKRATPSGLYGNVPIIKGGTGANNVLTARENMLFTPLTATSEDGVTYTVTNNNITSLVNGLELIILPDMTSTSTQTKLKINSLAIKKISMSVADTGEGDTPSKADWLVANVPVKVRYSATKNAWIADVFKMDATKMTGILKVENGGTGASIPQYALYNFINGGQSVESDIQPDDVIGLIDSSRFTGIKTTLQSVANSMVSNNLVAGTTANGTVTSENADFAEVGEWSDGNPDAEDRLGYFVTVSKTESGITMVKATSTSDVRGVTIANPAFCANASENKYGEDGELLPKYNYVAFAGFATVIDNGTCTINERCMPADDGTAIPSTNDMGYQVIERVDDTHVLILVEPSADMLNRIKTDITKINKELLNKSDTSHTHDDRYYTEMEIDTKLSGKSDTSHTHDDSYYKKAEVYNKTEVDNKVGGLITSGTTDLTAGTSSLASGVIYAMYE